MLHVCTCVCVCVFVCMLYIVLLLKLPIVCCLNVCMHMFVVADVETIVFTGLSVASVHLLDFVLLQGKLSLSLLWKKQGTLLVFPFRPRCLLMMVVQILTRAGFLRRGLSDFFVAVESAASRSL